jgi:hypothetical protein
MAAVPATAAQPGAPPASSPPAAAAVAAAASSPAAAAVDSVVMTGAERAAQFKSAWDAKRKALCKAKFNVGHWLGLSTEERKDLSVTLCQEVLFNPQPSSEKGKRLAVEWSVQSYWTTYEVRPDQTRPGQARPGRLTSSSSSSSSSSV